MYDHEISPAVTCDAIMAHWTSSGNTLAGKDFSSAFSCPAESYDVKNTVNIVATYCCGTGDAASRRSACWADYSYICADPSSYTPSAEWEAASASNGNTATSCQKAMEYSTSPGSGHVFEGYEFVDASSAAESCTTPSAIEAVRAVAAKCCASGNSVCHSDTVDSATLGGRFASSAVGVVSVFAVLLGFH